MTAEQSAAPPQQRTGKSATALAPRYSSGPAPSPISGGCSIVKLGHGASQRVGPFPRTGSIYGGARTGTRSRFGFGMPEARTEARRGSRTKLSRRGRLASAAGALQGLKATMLDPAEAMRV